jgi:hypothetical protein
MRVVDKLEGEGLEAFDVLHDLGDWAHTIDAHESDVLDRPGLCRDLRKKKGMRARVPLLLDGEDRLRKRLEGSLVIDLPADPQKRQRHVPASQWFPHTVADTVIMVCVG